MHRTLWDRDAGWTRRSAQPTTRSNEMGELYNRMAGDLKLKNYAPGTQKAYLTCATRYARFHVGRSPSVLGEREVRDFLLDLALKQATPAVMKMHLAGLRFLYSTTLRRPEVVV